MAFQYPAKPWVDGQEIKMTVGGREVVVAKYDASKNLWQHLQVNKAGVFNYVYACHITIDRDECPADPCLETISWDNIKDVQTALDWIYLRLQELFEKVELLEERVKQNEIDIDFLYKTLSAIENLADVSEFLNRLDEIEERIDNLDATDINQGTLENFAFSFAANNRTIPENVAVGTQQETNYYLADMVGQLAAANQQEHADIIRLIAELDEHTIWFGAGPPEDDEQYKFWWDTERLDLTIQWNGQWWPVSIPPEQIEAVAASLAALQRDTLLNEQSIAQLRRDIAAGDFRPGLQQVLDVSNTTTSGAEFGGKVKVSPGSSGNEAVTYQQLQNVESSIPSSDEFYLKTGGDLNGYVYSKGNNSGYYLGAADGSLLANFREKLPLEATLELRGTTTFKLNGYAPGDNQAFAFVHLDTSEVNGLQIHRLADPAGGRDPIHRDYLQDKLDSSPSNGAARFKWTVDTNKPESAVPAERHASLIGGSKMQELTKIRFSDASRNGHKLSFPHVTEPIYGSGAFLTAWYYNIDTKQWTWRGSSKVSNLQYTNNYIEATLQSPVGPQSFSNGSTYYFTIGGFF